MKDPTLGDLLRERRHERGIGLSALARELGVGKSYVSMWENGSRSPSDDHFEALSRLLEIPSDVLRVAAGRLPPDVATAVPQRVGTIVSAIRCDDRAALVEFPTGLTPEMHFLVDRSATESAASAQTPPFTESLRAGKNSSSYRAHSYHTKVPPEAVETLVRHYTSEGQLVADPFCGSGMTGVAAIRAGRHALLSDFSPAAVHIATNYTTPCDAQAFLGAVARVADRVRPTMAWLYEFGPPSDRGRVEYTVWSDVLQCPECHARVLYWNAARDPSTGAVTDLVRCPGCQHGGEKRLFRWIGEEPVQSSVKRVSGRTSQPPSASEMDLVAQANSRDVLHWVPQTPFSASREMWRAGHAAAGIQSVADFYTRRNLHALAALRHAIFEESDDRMRAALLFAFTAVVNRASKRYQWNHKRPTNVMTGTLYVSSLRYEWNVWSLFDRKTRDVARYYEHLDRPVARAGVVRSSAAALAHLPDRSIDYVFMDPPFGSNIFYADSSLLWDAWLGVLTDEADEIVVNKHRRPAEGGKTLDDYQRLMSKSFSEVARVLKRSACATLMFNNSNDAVWCAIQDALSDAGLEVRHAVGLDKVHPSIKGVTGAQAKEDVVALDTLIELRHAARSPSTARVSNKDELRSEVLRFAQTQSAPFTTDQVFSHLVRSGLTSGGSLSGVSIQATKRICNAEFARVGTRWRRAPR